jgi:hypothetical protein
MNPPHPACSPVVESRCVGRILCFILQNICSGVEAVSFIKSHGLLVAEENLIRIIVQNEKQNVKTIYMRVNIVRQLRA